MNSGKITVFQHVPFEGPGSICDWAKSRDLSTEIQRLFEGHKPVIDGDSRLLVIMGGPMSVNEEEKHPRMAEERRAVEWAMGADIPVLGVCLGAQLLAKTLGAKVVRNQHKEIGWFSVERTTADDILPEKFEAFHWHGERFEIPSGARLLARSEACESQAFIYGDKVVGLQFHLEMTPPGVRNLVENCRDDLDSGKYVQSAEEMSSAHHRFYRINGIMNAVLNRLVQ